MFNTLIPRSSDDVRCRSETVACYRCPAANHGRHSHYVYRHVNRASRCTAPAWSHNVSLPPRHCWVANESWRPKHFLLVTAAKSTTITHTVMSRHTLRVWGIFNEQRHFVFMKTQFDFTIAGLNRTQSVSVYTGCIQILESHGIGARSWEVMENKTNGCHFFDPLYSFFDYMHCLLTDSVWSV